MMPVIISGEDRLQPAHIEPTKEHFLAASRIQYWKAQIGVIENDRRNFASLKEKLEGRNLAQIFGNTIADRQRELRELDNYLKQNDAQHGLPIGAEYYAQLASLRSKFDFHLNLMKIDKAAEDQKNPSSKACIYLTAAACMVATLAVFGALKGLV
ncbi:MAG: hypothetical protein LLG04_06820 [Parachlamydia sp.]|nr:hypothetical protein [Parachlamydia sp.]